MENYSHVSRSVSCKWSLRLIRILIVKLLRFNNKKISLLLFANKICKRPGEKRCIVLNFFIIQGLKYFFFTPCWSVLEFWKIKLEKSSSTNWIYSLQKSISKLIFAGYTGSKNQVWNRQKIKFKTQFSEIQISKIKYR